MTAQQQRKRASGQREDESRQEQLDRNMAELLQELRVAQTGVQILFAFLLGVAFTQRFADVTDFQRWTFVATLIFSSLATALLIAPVAVHRALFRRQQREEVVESANRFAIGGILMMLLAIVSAVLLVLDVVLDGTHAKIITGCLAAWFLWFWVASPLVKMRKPADG